MKFNNKAGFTLIEAIMIFSLLGILVFGMSAFIIEAMQGWVMVSTREAAIGNIRRAMDRVTGELRRIDKPENIITLTSSQVQFLDLSGATITFVQSGTNLLRNSDTLVTGLLSPEGLRLTYLGSTGEVTAVKQNVRSIRVWIALGSGPRVATLESAARIRNL